MVEIKQVLSYILMKFEYARKNMSDCEQKMSFVEFMQSSPFKDVDLDLTRDQSSCREIDL